MLGFDGKVQLCAHNFGSISEIVSKPMNSSTEQITNVSSQETKQTVRKIERNKCKTQNKRTNNLQYEKVLVFTTRIIKFDSRRKKKTYITRIGLWSYGRKSCAFLMYASTTTSLSSYSIIATVLIFYHSNNVPVNWFPASNLFYTPDWWRGSRLHSKQVPRPLLSPEGGDRPMRSPIRICYGEVNHWHFLNRDGESWPLHSTCPPFCSHQNHDSDPQLLVCDTFHIFNVTRQIAGNSRNRIALISPLLGLGTLKFIWLAWLHDRNIAIYQILLKISNFIVLNEHLRRINCI